MRVGNIPDHFSACVTWLSTNNSVSTGLVHIAAILVVTECVALGQSVGIVTQHKHQ